MHNLVNPKESKVETTFQTMGNSKNNSEGEAATREGGKKRSSAKLSTAAATDQHSRMDDSNV
jgi:hypothetical protein